MSWSEVPHLIHIALYKIRIQYSKNLVMVLSKAAYGHSDGSVFSVLLDFVLVEQLQNQ